MAWIAALLTGFVVCTLCGAGFARERWAETVDEPGSVRVSKSALSGFVGGFGFLMVAAWVIALGTFFLLLAGALFYMFFGAVL